MLPWWVFHSLSLLLVWRRIIKILINIYFNPRGFVVLVTCAFMIAIGQQSTISGFALVVTLSVRALHWVLIGVYASKPTIPTSLDLCWAYSFFYEFHDAKYIWAGYTVAPVFLNNDWSVTRRTLQRHWHAVTNSIASTCLSFLFSVIYYHQ